jgi:hypothetical protein
VRDIAGEWNALTRSGHENVDASSAPTCFRPRLREALSDALGRTIKYGGNDMDAWEKQMSAYMPAWGIYDFRLMYEMFQSKGLKATDAQLKECEAIVGHALRSTDFVRETAAA